MEPTSCRAAPTREGRGSTRALYWFCTARPLGNSAPLPPSAACALRRRTRTLRPVAPRHPDARAPHVPRARCAPRAPCRRLPHLHPARCAAGLDREASHQHRPRRHLAGRDRPRALREGAARRRLMARPSAARCRERRARRLAAARGGRLLQGEGLRPRRTRQPALAVRRRYRHERASVVDAFGEHPLLRVPPAVRSRKGAQGHGRSGPGRPARTARPGRLYGHPAERHAARPRPRAAAHHRHARLPDPPPAAGEPGADDLRAVRPVRIALRLAGPDRDRPRVGGVRPPDHGYPAVLRARPCDTCGGRPPHARPGDQPHRLGQRAPRAASGVVRADGRRTVREPRGVGRGVGRPGRTRPTARRPVGTVRGGLPHLVPPRRVHAAASPYETSLPTRAAPKLRTQLQVRGALALPSGPQCRPSRLPPPARITQALP